MTTHQQDLDFIAYQAFHDKMNGHGTATANGYYKWGGPDAEEGNNGEDDMFIEAPDGTIYMVEVGAQLTIVCQECFTAMGKHKMQCSKR